MLYKKLALKIYFCLIYLLVVKFRDWDNWRTRWVGWDSQITSYAACHDQSWSKKNLVRLGKCVPCALCRYWLDTRIDARSALSEDSQERQVKPWWLAATSARWSRGVFARRLGRLCCRLRHFPGCRQPSGYRRWNTVRNKNSPSQVCLCRCRRRQTDICTIDVNCVQSCSVGGECWHGEDLCCEIFHSLR